MRTRSSSLLLDDLPTTVEIGGCEYEIYSDFRAGIAFELILQDVSLSDTDKILASIELFYPDETPPDIEAACDAFMEFYRCGKPEPKKPKESKNVANSGSIPPRLLDYDRDAPYVYAAFMSQYGIDLQDIEFLHWWKFSAMMDSLDENQLISKIMSYRAVDLRSIKDKSERSRLSRLKAKYALPNEAVIARRSALAESLFGAKAGGGNK